ncbi:MAG: pimelyl-ACP methyl ester esterase BioV [Sulfurovum sp.]|nr:pimelyl-ACP methyl ester esterase BioV [Sulfurovum sp.]
MKYFNGFCLKGEEELFEPYLRRDEFTVCGFSYGAQKALEYVYHTDRRVERLILLSPAFFQSEKASFVRTQVRYFDAGKEAYIQQFLANVAYPRVTSLSAYLTVGDKSELESLLGYIWEDKKLEAIVARGTVIEVFIGKKDKILKIEDTLRFFNRVCTTYCIKESGHLLEG